MSAVLMSGDRWRCHVAAVMGFLGLDDKRRDRKDDELGS